MNDPVDAGAPESPPADPLSDASWDGASKPARHVADPLTDELPAIPSGYAEDASVMATELATLRRDLAAARRAHELEVEALESDLKDTQESADRDRKELAARIADLQSSLADAEENGAHADALQIRLDETLRALADARRDTAQHQQLLAAAGDEAERERQIASGETAAVQRELASARDEIARAAADLAASVAERDEVARALETAKDESRRVKQLYADNKRDYRIEMDTLRTQSAATDEKAASIQATAEATAGENEQLRSENASLRRQFDRLGEVHAEELAEARTRSRDRLRDAEDARTRAEVEVSILGEQLRRAQGQLREMREKASHSAHALDLAEATQSPGDVPAESDRAEEVAESRRIIERLEAENADLRRAVESAQDRAEITHGKLEAVQRRIDRAETNSADLVDRLRDAEATADGLRSQLESTNPSIGGTEPGVVSVAELPSLPEPEVTADSDPEPQGESATESAPGSTSGVEDAAELEAPTSAVDEPQPEADAPVDPQAEPMPGPEPSVADDLDPRPLPAGPNPLVKAFSIPRAPMVSATIDEPVESVEESSDRESLGTDTHPDADAQEPPETEASQPDEQVEEAATTPPAEDVAFVPPKPIRYESEASGSNRGIVIVAVVGLAAVSALVLAEQLQTILGIIVCVAVAAALVAAIRSATNRTSVSLEAGTLRMNSGGHAHTFYLSSESTDVRMVDEPGDRTWKVEVLRRGMEPVVIDAGDVDPVKFTAALRAARPDL